MKTKSFNNVVFQNFPLFKSVVVGCMPASLLHIRGERKNTNHSLSSFLTSLLLKDDLNYVIFTWIYFFRCSFQTSHTVHVGHSHCEIEIRSQSTYDADGPRILQVTKPPIFNLKNRCLVYISIVSRGEPLLTMIFHKRLNVRQKRVTYLLRVRLNSSGTNRCSLTTKWSHLNSINASDWFPNCELTPAWGLTITFFSHSNEKAFKLVKPVHAKHCR